MAGYFPYRAEILFKEIVIDCPIGKTKCNAILVEFQILGSPYIHSFLWIVNARAFTKDNKEEYIGFVENIIHVTLPHETEQPEPYKLITTFRCSRPEMFCKKMFLKISQNSQQNACARVPFLITLQARGTYFYRTPVFI